MSFCATAISAAKTAVNAPTQVTTVSAVVVPPGSAPGLHQRINPRNQIDARGHHRRRVNQRGDRRGAFHRVRQPDVQRKLAALARRSGKDQQANRARPYTSDYALYWFDYKAGYDTVFTEFGWNNSRQMDIALCRGAATVKGKDWGAIITWTYDQPPYF